MLGQRFIFPKGGRECLPEKVMCEKLLTEMGEQVLQPPEGKPSGQCKGCSGRRQCAGQNQGGQRDTENKEKRSGKPGRRGHNGEGFVYSLEGHSTD